MQEIALFAAVFLYDPAREKAILENPQIFQNCNYKIKFLIKNAMPGSPQTVRHCFILI